VAAVCGLMMYLTRREKMVSFYEDGGRLAFGVGFTAFLSLPIVGFFYAHVLKYYANEAYVNLMWGRGDVIAGGVDWWWMKQLIVAGVLGACLRYFASASGDGKAPVPIPRIFVYAVALFYLSFYVAMGMIMTWAFFWWMASSAVAGALLAGHLRKSASGSPRGVYLLVGLLSFATVMLGGYAREASRPRFENRISAQDKIYIPAERAPYLMVDIGPADLPPMPPRPAPEVDEAVVLIKRNCTGCHTLERIRNYKLKDWGETVALMRAYGLRITNDEADTIVAYLRGGKPF
jgi:hypothetical protein